MPRHLRIVRTPDPDRLYVVARTAHVQPGSPYVIAVCAEDAVAAMLSMAGHETYGAEDMRRRPELARALQAWDQGDHRLHRSERSEALAFARWATSPIEPPRRGLHPSLLGKAIGSRAAVRSAP